MKFGIELTLSLIALVSNASSDFSFETSLEGMVEDLDMMMEYSMAESLTDAFESAIEFPEIEDYTGTNPLLNEIEGEGLCAKSELAGQRDHLQCMIEQILSYGGHINKVEMKEYAPGINGMIATEDIYKGDNIVYIPRTFLITPLEAEASETFKYLYEEGHVKNFGNSNDKIALFVMEELKNPDSKWRDYFALLPPNFSNMPTNYNDEELEMLNGNDIKLIANQKMKTNKTTYENLARVVPNFKEMYSFEEYNYAKCSTDSRNFGLKMDPKDNFADEKTMKNTSVTVPFGDLFNHKVPTDLAWRWGSFSDLGKAGWFGRAVRDVKKGE